MSHPNPWRLFGALEPESSERYGVVQKLADHNETHKKPA